MQVGEGAPLLKAWFCSPHACIFMKKRVVCQLHCHLSLDDLLTSRILECQPGCLYNCCICQSPREKCHRENEVRKRSCSLFLTKGDNARKHYLLSGQFWEHFQLLNKKMFVKLKKLACWHWQWIHNAHVNLPEKSRAGAHSQRKALEPVRKGFSQKHESLKTFVTNHKNEWVFLFYLLNMQTEGKKATPWFPFGEANATTSFYIWGWVPFFIRFEWPCL